MIRILSIVLVACAIVSGSPQFLFASIDMARMEDVYAVYSVVMTRPLVNSIGPDSPVLVIASKTIQGTPSQPCVAVPTEYATGWREVLAEFNRHEDSPGVLEARLRISKPYRLVREAEVLQLQAAARRAAALPDAKSRMDDLFFLADVYFNRDRTLALTLVSNYNGARSALARWVVLQKNSSGLWEERNDWVTCAIQAPNVAEASGTELSSRFQRTV